jgi:hypothetical protein
MRSIEELLEAAVDEFPNGLHDADLERFDIDWAHARLTFDVLVDVGSDPLPTYRRARFVVEGLIDCAIGAASNPSPAEPLSIIEGVDTPPSDFAQTPPGHFFHAFVDTTRNRPIYICGRSATCAWLD